LCCIVFIAASCADKGVKIPPMNRNFSKNNKNPMGTYVAHQMFEHQFDDYFLYEQKKRFSEVNNDIEGSKNLYFIVADELKLLQSDVDDMLQYAGNGNRLFISAAYMDEQLLDTLGVNVKYNGNFIPMLFENNKADEMRRTVLQLYDTASLGKASYGFFYFPMLDYFKNFDSSNTTILGLNEKNKPNFIALKHGDGIIYLHMQPEAFSNYFLLKEKNKEYFEKVLSYMNSDRKTIYWDDFYRKGLYPEKNFSSFGVFLKYPPLKWALYLSMIGLLLFVLMGMKRRQRAIPILVSNTNSSVSFVETIGRLYLQKKDHHNIVQKMATYFLEKIRTKYYLNTSHINAEFMSSLARKSGVPETEVKSIFQYIQQLQEAETINDVQLLELHNRLLPFFKT
jgi:hypothetical protein